MRVGTLFSRFVLAGLIVAVVQLSLLYVLIMGGAYYLYASTVSYGVGIMLNFLLQKYWSFQSAGNVERQFVLFVGNSLINLVANVILMYVLVDIFVAPTVLAQIGSLAVLTVYNFSIYSILFKKP